MKKNIFIFSFIIWIIFSILVYIFLFSSFGYFYYKEREFYKKKIAIENELLEKDNEILQEKIIQYNKINSNKQQENYQIILFKFENLKDIQGEEQTNTDYTNLNLIYSTDIYKYLYFFLVSIGFIFLIFLKIK